MKQGLLLFAHGARDARWALPFEAVAARVCARAPEVQVRLSFLEFMTPGLVEAGTMLADAGCTQVSVVPLFLGSGGHVRKDLPTLLAELSGRHPQVTWSLRQAIGEVESVIDAMADAALQATEPVAP